MKNKKPWILSFEVEVEIDAFDFFMKQDTLTFRIQLINSEDDNTPLDTEIAKLVNYKIQGARPKNKIPQVKLNLN